MTEHVEHALLSPSSAERWIPCPGSKEGNKIESKSNAAADKGTEQHEIAATMLRDGKIVVLTEDDDIESLDVWQVTLRFVAFVQSLIPDCDEWFVEEKLYSSIIPDEFFGTLDFFGRDGDMLTVVDLKTGRKPVVAKNNKQLMSYLCLARDRFPDAKRFFGVIVQGQPDMEEFTAEQLDQHYAETQHSLDSDERHAGGHCEYCPLVLLCDENRRWVTENAVEIFQEDDDLSLKADTDWCLKIMELGPVVERLVEQSKEALKLKMLAGQEIEGWKLGQKLGDRKWVNEGDLDTRLMCIAGDDPALSEDDIYKRELLSPAQIEKVLSKKLGLKPKVRKELLDPFVSREVKPVQAYPETTKCEPYSPPVEDLFEDVKL